MQQEVKTARLLEKAVRIEVQDTMLFSPKRRPDETWDYFLFGFAVSIVRRNNRSYEQRRKFVKAIEGRTKREARQRLLKFVEHRNISVIRDVPPVAVYDYLKLRPLKTA